MIALAAFATLVFILVGGAVGVRLLWLAWRTRGLPETLLGTGLFLIVGVGYPMSLMAGALGGGEVLGRTLAAGAVFFLSVGWMCVYVFTWRVFRPGFAAAEFAACAAVLGLAALAAWRIVFLATSGPVVLDPSNPQVLAIQVLALVVYVWTTAESFAYWSQLRRRLALGLADPVVVNRFWLWGVVGSLSFLSLVGPVAAGFAGVDPAKVPAVRLSTAVAGLGCAAGLYLAFLPPRAYLRRVTGAASA